MQQVLIKNETQLSELDNIKFRESFVTQYCAEKGWDKTDLSFEQIIEIRTHNQWKTPGLLVS